jgi:hypothetical protein
MTTNKWPGPSYEARVTFSAPLRFVFDWCTDYTPQDAQLEGGKYRRRILSRTRREVVYEDLEDSKSGWFWSHHVVHLFPPTRWHSESVGSHRTYSLDYRLSPEPGGRTELVLTARRRPTELGGKNPKAVQWARSVEKDWSQFRRALERDYKKSRTPSR